MILIRRLIAFLIDYMILAGYGIVLSLVAMGLEMSDRISFPWTSHVIGFVSLTLPVLMYFLLLENGAKQASLGKQVMRLKVTGRNREKAPLSKLLVRNLLKFMPWEIAHLGVHWAYYYNQQNAELPEWVWLPLVGAQLLAVLYVISIVFNSRNQGLYERWSGTCVLSSHDLSEPKEA